MNVIEFAKGTEKMIDPIKVGTLHHMQQKLKNLPAFIERKIVTSAAKKADKMGFVVEPYAFFLVYEIDDLARFQRDLPDSFVPAKAKVFEGDAEKYIGIICIFRAHTSAFWGSRAEFYAIAKNEVTGLKSWIILDYLSDTISFDEKHGLRSPSVDNAAVTTTCEGDYLAEIQQNGKTVIDIEASLKHPKTKKLDEQLWIDGNTSIAYSKELGGKDGDLFSLTFLPQEMESAWEIPLADVRKAKVIPYPEISKGKLTKAVCFPFAQHMLSDSPGTKTHYGSKEALEAAAVKIDFKKLKGFAK
ncbi:hypothetical protein IJG91_01895 [Candidatus Saccharibacteria bacterium]|nr:hypothetical protein [Candidatus Saccharibacteria bacterium]